MSTVINNRYVQVGPLDPDKAGQLAGNSEATQKADELLAANAKNFPPELVAAQVGQVDEHASEHLDLAEISKVVGQEVIDASVRGIVGQPKRVIYIYRTPGGRAVKGLVDYAALSKSRKAAAAAPVDTPKETKPAADPNAGRVAELEDQVAELTKLVKGLAKPEEEVESAPEVPWDGYDDQGAKDIVKYLESDDATEEEKQAVLAYESANAGRKTIIEAASSTASE